MKMNIAVALPIGKSGDKWVEHPLPHRQHDRTAGRERSPAAEMWHGYGAYNPANLGKFLEIYRVYFNCCLTDKDKKTPAMRLGLADAPIDIHEILYFRSAAGRRNEERARNCFLALGKALPIGPRTTKNSARCCARSKSCALPKS
jgi:hypothetical protein